MEPIVLVDKASTLEHFVKQLSHEQHIAIDTESNSFHAYFERVCLIQISTTTQDYIIDPLALKEIETLGEVLNNPNIEKILHAASNDVLGLKRDFDFRIHNLFDTAVACRLLGRKQLGLARILQEHFGVQLNKKWQRCDWGRRPLKAEQLAYAQLDTHYLIPLRHQLAVGLHAENLWETAKEAFERLCAQEAQDRPFNTRSFLNIKGARALDSTGRRILQALYIYREKEAQRRDRAPFRVLSNETLIRLARSRPHSLREFSRTKGLPHNYRRGRRAENLLQLIHQNEQSPDEAEAQN